MGIKYTEHKGFRSKVNLIRFTKCLASSINPAETYKFVHANINFDHIIKTGWAAVLSGIGLKSCRERWQITSYCIVMPSSGKCVKCPLEQGSSNLILEGRCPAEFSSNLPQHTCLEVWSIPSKTLISCFRCVWLGLELNSAGHRALQDRTWWPLL